MLRKIPLILVFVIFAAGVYYCDSSPTESEEDEEMMSFGKETDVQMARAIWASIEGYESSWSQYPGMEGWQPGNSPHGAWLKYYVNETALSDLQNFPHGSVIIKENYPDTMSSTGPITIMARIEGYDSEIYDWFWAKYLPDGSLDTNEDGVKLAGQVAKGAGENGEHAACIGCHSGASGGDYAFVNDQ